MKSLFIVLLAVVFPMSFSQAKRASAKKDKTAAGSSKTLKRAPEPESRSLRIPQTWTFVRSAQGVFLWKLRANPEVRGLYNARTLKAEEQTDWSRVKSEEMFRKWEGPRKKMMETMGVTEWQAQSYQWDKEKEGRYQLTVQGSYKSRNQQQVFFREVHLHTQDQTLQMLITSPEPKILDQREVGQFVQSAKADWIKGGV